MAVLIDNRQNQHSIPLKKLTQTAQAVLNALGCPEGELSILIVDDPAIATLNRDYLDRKGPTNVIAFPMQEGEFSSVTPGLLGDVVICAPVVAREAQEQGKTLEAHWAHMTVHGTLHLLGYDHIDEQDALVMEALETAILARLHYPCPYRGEDSKEPLQA